MNKQDHDELLSQGLTQQEIDSLTQKGFTKEEMMQAIYIIMKSRKDRISLHGL